MKILLSTREKIVGGGEIFLRDLAIELLNMGHEVIVRSHDGAGITKLLPKVKNIGILNFSAIRCVVANDFRSLWMATILNPFSRKVFVVHGIWQISWLRMIFCWGIRAKVLCVSKSLATKARNSSKFRPEISQILLCPNKPKSKPDSDQFVFFEKKSTSLRIGNIARLDPVKNLKLYSDLIECLINLDYKVDSSLLTYEPVNKVQSDILSSLSSDIRIINHVSAYEYLTQVDILVNTSEYESFGYSLFEALLSGVAVFSTATEGPSEFLIQELSKGYFPGVSNASTLCSAFLNFRESVDREKYISSVESVLNQRSPKMMVSTVLDSLK